jgi:hypothetical protein
MANTVTFLKVTSEYGVLETRDSSGKLVGAPSVLTKARLEAQVFSSQAEKDLATARLSTLAAS